MKRVLSTGGATLLFKPLPIEVAEQNYKAVVEALGLADKSPEERVQGLLSAAQDDLWQKVPPSAPMLPVIDQNTVPGLPTFQNVSAQGDDPSFSMPGKKWCDAVMVGESKLDANIIAFMGLDARNPGIASKFIDSVNKTFSSQPDFAAQLLSAYNISSTSSDQDAMLSILLFASETCFYAPARAMATGWPSSSKFFLYHFNEGIPWEGRFQGEAGHILDVAYLFQNYNEHLDEKQKKVARAYAEDFIAFVNGEDPWTPAKPDRFSARVYGPSSEGITTKFTKDGNPKDIGRDERVLKLGESIGYDNLITAFENFFRGQ
jgi:carboxylesterase type B